MLGMFVVIKNSKKKVYAGLILASIGDLNPLQAMDNQRDHTFFKENISSYVSLNKIVKEEDFAIPNDIVNYIGSFMVNNLAGVNLIRKKLSRANLTNANLSNANLSRANLTNADLTNAHLIGANLINARLRGANLTNTNLTNANLRGAKLTNANLRGANLCGANLSGVCVNGHIASRSDLLALGADLTGVLGI